MIFLTRQLERTVLVHMYTEFIISVQKKFFISTIAKSYNFLQDVLFPLRITPFSRFVHFNRPQ